MLRLIVLLLLLANGAYFAWSHGYMAVIGFAPTQQTEPQRVQTQIKPEAIRLLNTTEAKRVEALVSASATKAPECLQSAFLSDAQANAARASLNAANVPEGAWRLEQGKEAARWIVYMGKYANSDVLAKKKSELRELSVPFETPKNPTLEPGLSLGAYPTPSQANESLANLAKRGVRTAKVIQELPERTGQVLKFPFVDDALRSQLDSLKSVVGPAGWVACKTF